MKVFDAMTDEQLTNELRKAKESLDRLNWEIEYAVANYATARVLLDRLETEIAERKAAAVPTHEPLF